MSPRIHIRCAKLADVEAIADIEKRAFDARYYSSIWRRREFTKAIAGERHIVLVAEVGGRVRGYALGLTRSNSKLVRFYSLAVHPEAKGLKLGEILFHAMEEEAQRRGFGGLLLEIRKDNDFLRNRYGGYGYLPYREVPDYYPDGCACTKMRKMFPARTTRN